MVIKCEIPKYIKIIHLFFSDVKIIIGFFLYYTERRDTALLSLIPVLCPSNVRLRIPGGSKIWRPTIAESMNAFICHIKVRYFY